ncbi:MAG: UbiA family prenyltransferase [Beijerinckiaceae bacterium]|nr:UbiA family prenyltransferase [Beijerinckiaceae bacterium]
MSEAVPLVVDLQTGLLRPGLEREGFWRALGAGEGKLALAFLQGRGSEAAHALADADASDLANLPMNPAALAIIRERRLAGGRVVLVTDGPEALARRFSLALDLGEDAIGGLAGGEERAAGLSDIFGEGQYDYMGGGDAGMPALRSARHAFAVDPSARMAQGLAREAGGVTFLEAPKAGAAPYLKALRPHQWVKNLLVFLPMIAGHQFDQRTFALSLMAFLAFSMIASCVYVLNDLVDLAADRAHPRKRKRPMASGAVPLSHAAALAAACLACGFALALLAGSGFVAALCVYTVLTTAYSLRLKREPVMDVCVLAGLYTLRIVAGAAATGIELSVWLLAFAIFIFLSLAAIKRQAELVDNKIAGREKAAGRGYRVDDLPIIETMAVTAGYVSVLVLALYLNAPSVQGLYRTPEFLWGVCVVLLYWITRAAMIAHRGEMDDDPIVFAFRDRVSRLCGLAIALALFAATLS